MSQTCAITPCNRTSRARCHCCQQDVCIVHLNEHNDILNNQLNPLIDILNTLGNRIQTIHIENSFQTTRERLEQWRDESHRMIDQYYEMKCEEFDRLIQDKINEQQEKYSQTQAKISELIREQQVTREDLSQLISTIDSLEQEIKNFEQKFIDLQIQPLVLETNLIQIRGINEDDYDLSLLSSAYKIINLPEHSYATIAASNQYLLIHQAPNLCLVNHDLNILKRILWSHGVINDICWSSTLDRFLLTEEKHLYSLNCNTMLIEKIKLSEKKKWMSCTCSEEYLYLSTNEWGSSIMKINFTQNKQLGKEYQSPKICHIDEYIDMITYNKNKLAILIRNNTKKSIRFELRSAAKLERLWMCPFDFQWNFDKPFYCCLFLNEDWLIADYQTGRLLHLSKSGQMKSILNYNTMPFCVTRFTTNTLAVATANGIHFHELNYKKTYTIYIL